MTLARPWRMPCLPRMRQRDDLLTDNSLGGIEVIQLTAEEVPSSHVYMENANGRFIRLTGGNGADVHVIADDGTNLRDLPWGRDGNEFCQGHQCWIGADERALTSISMREPGVRRVDRSARCATCGTRHLADTGRCAQQLVTPTPAGGFLPLRHRRGRASTDHRRGSETGWRHTLAGHDSGGGDECHR